MTKYIIVSILALWLSACSRGHDGGNYAWIGCHVVTDNPHCYPNKDKCVFAFGPEGDKKAGQRIYWKQENKYGKTGPIMTARPCRDDE